MFDTVPGMGRVTPKGIKVSQASVVRVAVATALGCALLSGCATDQTWIAEQNAIAPEHWSAPLPELQSPQALATQSWWQAWQDAQLMQLIEAAWQKNTDLLTARANLRAAAALADDATAALFPTLEASAQGSGTRRGGVSNENYSLGANYNWSISLAGGNVAARRAARYEAMASAMTLADARTAVASEVAQNYVSLRLAYVKKRIAEMTLANYRQAHEIANWNYQAGLGDKTEVEQAVSNVETARAALPLVDLSIAKYRNALARLTGQAVHTLDVSDTSSVPQAPMQLAVSVPAKMLADRPDMRAAHLQVQAASERVYQARSQWLPNLNISGNLGTQAATIAALGASGTGVASLIGALSMPILNWGKQVTATEQQLAQLDKARAQYSATLLKALEECENALTAIAVAQRREAALEAALTSAESAADLAMQQYRSGLIDYQTVLNTQRSLFSARENMQSNKADLASGLIALYRAMGAGWVEADQRFEPQVLPELLEQAQAASTIE